MQALGTTALSPGTINTTLSVTITTLRSGCGTITDFFLVVRYKKCVNIPWPVGDAPGKCCRSAAGRRCDQPTITLAEFTHLSNYVTTTLLD